MSKLKELKSIFEDLTGEKIDNISDEFLNIELFEDDIGLGYSQFNEILLLLGLDRISYNFFQYLVSGKIEYQLNSSIKSKKQLEEGVERFMKLALIYYGNLKFAFNILSTDDEELEEKIGYSESIDETVYKLRHKPIKEIEKIPASKTYLLGYCIRNNQNNKQKEIENRLKYIEIGKKNQLAYLSSDHLDIYIATSMRLEHEYIFVHDLVEKIFKDKNLRELNLRWFDPTQAFCDNRIDKGLAEALMLKRAKFTLYLAQESDTLGKDSELASTLAQGKPVIAFVPIGDKSYVDELLKNLKTINPLKKEKEIILEQLQIFNPLLAWKDDEIKNILNNIEKTDINMLKDRLYKEVKQHYDNRAKTLKEIHPLGIQVYLDTGVANGVLVVRNTKDCSKLIRAIITSNMEFIIERENKDNGEYIYLKETISQSIFRLITGDVILTNTFWNFYI